jgi:hypothetical protein
MTISYQRDVASSTAGGFTRLLFKWKERITAHSPQYLKKIFLFISKTQKINDRVEMAFQAEKM